MEHKQTVTEVKESRLSVKQKVLFGMGDYLNTITYGMISAFLMAFLTDTLLIPMAAVTAIMSLSKLWDAINDPVIGVIIDKSRSPKGVYRPWLIRMMVPFALSNILLWLPIGHWSTSAKITVVSIVYCLYMVWQLYRSEFFTFSLVTATAGVVFFLTARTSYMANRIGGSILLALILIGTALVVFLCAKNRGRLTIGGKTEKAVMREVQFHPVREEILHIDFYRVQEGKPVAISIPVRLTGNAEGVKVGGKLVLSTRKIFVSGPVDKLPDEITVDVTTLGVGKTIFVGDLKSDDLKFLTPATTAVCAVRVTRASRGAAAEAAQ